MKRFTRRSGPALPVHRAPHEPQPKDPPNLDYYHASGKPPAVFGQPGGRTRQDREAPVGAPVPAVLGEAAEV